MNEGTEGPPTRPLDPDVYDALELSALAFGGIGAGRCYLNNGDPFCAVGHLDSIADNAADARRGYGAVLRLFGGRSVGLSNDNAVIRYNAGKNRPKYARIPFEAWCKELGIVRGVTNSRLGRT